MSNKKTDEPAPEDPVSSDPHEHADEAKGYPHSDRHEAETLAGRIEKKGPAETKVK